MKFGNLLRILKSRFGVISLIFLVTTGTAAIVSFLLPKQYKATVALISDLKLIDPVSGNVVLTPQSVSGYLSTQVDIIKSERTIRRVIADQGLDRIPENLAIWQKATKGVGDPTTWLAEAIARDLDITPSREGSTINVSFQGTDPVFITNLVNGVAQAYVETVLELKTEPAKKFAAWFESQTKSHRAVLEAAQRKLSEFQREKGIVTSEERFDVENARLQELSTQLVTIQSQAADSRSRRAAIARQGREAMPEVVQNPLIQNLKSEIARSEVKLSDLRSRLGSSHPALLGAESELRGLRQRLASEVGRVTSSIETTEVVNRSRESEIRRSLDQQRERVLKIKAQRDDMSVLQREVDAAQKALDLVLQRLTQTNLESQAQQANVSILTPATVPSTPFRPKPTLNIVVGALLGLVVGVLAALTLEIAHRPIRSPEDLMTAANMPVLAVLPPADSRRSRRLIGDTGPTVLAIGGSGGPLRLGH